MIGRHERHRLPLQRLEGQHLAAKSVQSCHVCRDMLMVHRLSAIDLPQYPVSGQELCGRLMTIEVGSLHKSMCTAGTGCAICSLQEYAVYSLATSPILGA